MIRKSIFVQVEDGTKLHVSTSSFRTGKTVCVLVHGSGDGGYVWNDVRQELEDSCEILAVDLRGHGESGASKSGKYDLQTHVDDVAYVCKFLDLDKFTICGHSLGGQIAILLAAKVFPSRVAGVVLVDICAQINDESSRLASLILKNSIRAYASLEEYERYLMDSRPLLSSSTASEIARGALRATGAGFELRLDQAFVDYEHNYSERKNPEEWLRLARAIKCPALLIRGAASAMVSALCARQMHEAMPRSRLVTIQSAGHAVMSDNPDKFRQCMVNFVNGVSASKMSSG